MRPRLTLLIAILAVTCWSNDETTLAMRMYSNEQARKKGDLLTVVVTETSSSNKKESIATSKEGAASGSSPTFGAQDGRTLTRILGDIEIPGYSLQASSSYKGSGSSSSSDTLNATMTARVMDVHKNGLLVIRAERIVQTRDEKVTLVLTGLVRPRDISAANSIASTQISDFRVSYDSTGEVTNGSRPGWLWRFLQWINPF